MKKLLLVVGVTLAVIAFAIGVLFGFAYYRSEQALAQRYAIADAGLDIKATAKQVDRGRRLATTRGCTGCHGENLAGATVIDAPPIGRIVASNITVGGVGRLYDARTFEHAIRHGVAFDGTPLVFMPSEDYVALSDEDTAALIAYLMTSPAVAEKTPELEIGPVARVLWLFDEFPLLPAEKIDHTTAPIAPPVQDDPVAYGAYLASSCTGCHGKDWAGGLTFGPKTPPSANLTPHDDGLGRWSEADFIRAMREGKRPDGTQIDPFMPWKTMGQPLSDDELKAMWAYLQSLPAKGSPEA